MEKRRESSKFVVPLDPGIIRRIYKRIFTRATSQMNGLEYLTMMMMRMRWIYQCKVCGIGREGDKNEGVKFEKLLGNL